MQQEDAVLDAVGLVVGLDHGGEHVPFAGLHARRERPVAAQRVAALGPAGAAGGKDERRSDQRVDVLAPHRFLRARIEHAEHPVMAGEIGEIPRHRRIGLSQRIGAIDQRDVIELRAADALRLQDPEQTGVVQIALGFRRQAAQRLGPGGALAQFRDQRAGALDHGSMAVHALSGDQADIRLAAISGHLELPRPTRLGRADAVYRAHVGRSSHRADTHLHAQACPVMHLHDLCMAIPPYCAAASAANRPAASRSPPTTPRRPPSARSPPPSSRRLPPAPPIR